MNHPGGEINLLCWLCPKKPRNAHLSTLWSQNSGFCVISHHVQPWEGLLNMPPWHRVVHPREGAWPGQNYLLNADIYTVRFLPTPAHQFICCAWGLQLTPKYFFCCFCPDIAAANQLLGMIHKAQWYPRFEYLEISSSPAGKSQKTFASGVILSHS